MQLGDSLDMIASKFNTTVELLIEDNEIDETNVICLLYTSDAADDLLCVDLGGRRIIKKKNTRGRL